MPVNSQVDLFLDSMVNAPLKDDRVLMEFPFFSLQKQPRMDPIVYSDPRRNIKIEVNPGDRGIATIWDKDILIYMASLLNERLERNMPVDKTVAFNVYDLLRTTGRGTGKDGYDSFFDAIYRLRSTSILTTIEANGKKERTGFGWISDFRVIERETKAGKKVMAHAELTLNDWMFRAIVNDRRVLTINRDYFQITMGLKRRLYELARKHCGRQKRWDISLGKLLEKCGSMVEPRYFKRDLKRVIQDDDLPDYRISMNFDPADRKRAEEAGQDGRRYSNNRRIIVTILPRGHVGVDYAELWTEDGDEAESEE
jgi:plasmid replication initiation protein